MVDRTKTIKFHGQEVQNVVVKYMQRELEKPEATSLTEFNAEKNPEVCQTINVQVVSEFVTITFYKDEKVNSIVRRELIPTHAVEHIEIKDLRVE